MIVLSKFFYTIIIMIYIIHISDWEKHFSEATHEYIKRLGKNLEILTIKPIKHTEIIFIKKEETKKLIDKIDKIKWIIYLCDERWIDFNTIEFSKKIQEWRNNWENMIFIIWWSYWIDFDILERNKNINLIRLSSFVMPHWLAFLVLIEQIYRWLEIIKWSWYHHK